MTLTSSSAISHSQLVTRALEFLAEHRQLRPDVSLTVLLDEAGARFNLSPADAMALEHVLRSEFVAGHKGASQGAAHGGE